MFFRRRDNTILFFGRTPRLDLRAARAVVDQIATSPAGIAYLRSMLAGQTPAKAIETATDEEVIDMLATALATGRIVVVSRRPLEALVPALQGQDAAATTASETTTAHEAATKSSANDAQNKREEEETEENEFASIDPEQQAATLTEAAETGAPFCEECEKAQQASSTAEPVEDELLAMVDMGAQVATLSAAAETGAPFCEECEKAKAA